MKADRAQVDTVNGEEHAEEKEVAVIVEANAVVEPGTVVVHFEHAPAADRTVVSARRLRATVTLAACGAHGALTED